MEQEQKASDAQSNMFRKQMSPQAVNKQAGNRS
jgi:hypothetical protein